MRRLPSPPGVTLLTDARVIAVMLLLSVTLFLEGAAHAQVDGGTPSVDGGGADAGQVDAGLVDAGLVDAGLVDAGLVDAGSLDGGQTGDAGAPVPSMDGGSIDGGVSPDDGGDPSPPQDGGTVGTGGCDDGLTHLGRCDGDVLVFCQAGTAQRVDCGAKGLVCTEGTPIEGKVCGETDEEPSSWACDGNPSAPGGATPLVLALLALGASRGRRDRSRGR